MVGWHKPPTTNESVKGRKTKKNWPQRSRDEVDTFAAGDNVDHIPLSDWMLFRTWEGTGTQFAWDNNVCRLLSHWNRSISCVLHNICYEMNIITKSTPSTFSAKGTMCVRRCDNSMKCKRTKKNSVNVSRLKL